MGISGCAAEREWVGGLRRTCRGAVVPAIPIADGLHEGEVFSASFVQRAWQASLSSHDMPWAVVPSST